MYDGELVLRPEDARLQRISKGKEIALDLLSLGPLKFNPAMNTALYRWGARRAKLLAEANAAVANTLMSNQDVYSYATAYGSFGGSWIWNPILGTYTYLPFRGTGYSPFAGVMFLSPMYVRYPARLASTGSAFQAGRPAPASLASGASGSAPAALAVASPAIASPNVGGGDTGLAARRR